MMLSPEECYAPLKTKSTILFKALDNFVNAPVHWQNHFGFDCIELDISLRDKELALSQVHQLFPIKQLGLLRVPPFSFYDWHVDVHRLSCINMLLNLNSSSHCLFGKQIDKNNKTIIELNYKPQTFYLFNNKIEHSVTNFEGDRFMFSLYFEKETAFRRIKAGLSKAGLI